MPLRRELRTYVSALATLPALIMLLNESILASLIDFFSSIGFVAAIGLIALYSVLRRAGVIARIKSPTAQVSLESVLLVAPILYPMFIVITTNNPNDFIGVFFAYLIFGAVGSLYQIVFGAGVGALGKVTYFFLAYMLALMIYAGSIAGQAIGSGFSVLLAFDQISGVAIFFGYEGVPLELPLVALVRITTIISIPAITFSALAAQVRLSEVKDNPTGESRMVSTLRPTVAFLTFGSALLLLPALLISRLIVEPAVYLVTIVPPFVVAGAIIAVLIFTERRQ